MLAPFSPVVERLIYLRDVIGEEARQDIDNVDFDLVNHPCGTPSCLLGRVRVHRMVADSDLASHIRELFGMSAFEVSSVFGASRRVDGDRMPALEDLERRLKHVDNIIERHLNAKRP